MSTLVRVSIIEVCSRTEVPLYFVLTVRSIVIVILYRILTLLLFFKVWGPFCHKHTQMDIRSTRTSH